MVVLTTKGSIMLLVTATAMIVLTTKGSIMHDY
jgi:hypothetical protein